MTEDSNRRFSSRDVARLAGVSQSTVSRVFRGGQPVSPEHEKRVRDAAAALAYVPNLAARSMITQETRTLALVVPNSLNPVHAELITVAHDVAAEKGYRLMLYRDESADVGQSEPDILHGRAVDGVLYLASSLGSSTVERLLKLRIPTAVAIRDVSDGLQVDRFVSDPHPGADEAVALLVRQGHRDFAVVVGPDTISTANDRLEAFSDALRREGVVAPPQVIRVPSTFEHGVGVARDLASSKEKPTAVLAGADVLALGIIDGLRRAGLSVPRDVSVVGFDDVSTAAWAMVDLTTVHVPHHQMIVEATERLLERISNPGLVPAVRRYPSSLVVRSTTASPSEQDGRPADTLSVS